MPLAPMLWYFMIRIKTQKIRKQYFNNLHYYNQHALKMLINQKRTPSKAKSKPYHLEATNRALKIINTN